MPEEVEWPKIRRLLEAALERPASDRSAYLAEVCGGDAALREQVEIMLSSVGDSLLETEDDATQALDQTERSAAEQISLVGRTLAHYEVMEKIGQGGMGEVYRAWDTKLGRDVAIKVLSSAFASNPRRLDRFEREARMLASLNHPNIATIHGVEESHGVRFLVLEMVDGEGLEQRIAKGPVSPEEASELFAQIADALEAAHEKGIIHRDLKPANVKITPKGQVKVLDFGLAKTLGALPSGPRSSESGTKSLRATRAGVIVGTLVYMSPEQARGKPLDKRTDIWSFGCTLYEALTGKVPFEGESVFDTVAAIIESDPDWSALPAGVPSGTRRVLERSLEKDPERRLGDIREARAGLASEPSRRSRRVLTFSMIAVAMLVVGLGLWWVWSDRPRRPVEGSATIATANATPTVAVTALTNLTGEQDLDWLQEGMANLVRDRLAESRHLVVVSKPRWDAIARSAEASDDISQLAADSGIDYVVSGEFLSAPDGFVLTARVTNADEGVDLVARRIDGLDREGLLGSTDRLALLTKQALKIPHTETVEIWAADFAVDHPGAYEAYLAGLEYFNDFDFRGAERAFRAALQLEPAFHIARSRLARLLAKMGRTAEALATIEEIPGEAELGRRERLYIEGARALSNRDWQAAREQYQTLLGEYPYEVDARLSLAEVEYLDYNDEGALEQLLILADQEPENPTVLASLGETYLRMGQTEQAAAALDLYLAVSPQDPFGFTVLGDLYKVKGQLDVAVDHYRRALELNPEFLLARLGLALTWALNHEEDAAERLWRQIVEAEEEDPAYRIDAAFELSSLLRAQGRFAESLALLEQLEPVIADEGFREALALTVRGLNHLELGEAQVAEKLIDLAVERAPEPLSGYLFARGVLQLERGDLAGVRATAAEIRGHALPPGEQDRAEDKAAAYLEGRAQLAAGDTESALASLRRAIDLEGHPYAIYGLGLASALRAADRHAEAAELAAEAAVDRDPGDPRLDLELDRVRALLLEAGLRAEMAQTERARRLARAFLDRWSRAPADHPDVVLARRLANP